MACYHPLKMLDTGLKLISGKPQYRMIRMSDKAWNNPDCIQVPCGKCIGCRLEYSRQWANRMMLELTEHESAYFVTLTYDDYHVPVHYYAAPDTGEVFPILSLDKRDLQLFFKRLRKTFSDQHIRYFACGEYGPTTCRPHYHAIIFGLKLDDLELTGTSDQGHQQFFSKSLQRVWSRIDESPGIAGQVIQSPVLPIGRIMVMNVTWDACAYVARYVTKKVMGPDAKMYDNYNMVRPFTVMSRKPGIARHYYDSHVDMLYKYDKINIKTPKGGRSFRPPRYYDRLYDVEHHEELEEIKAIRKATAEARIEAKLAGTDLSYFELLELEERAHENRAKSLLRSEL